MELKPPAGGDAEEPGNVSVSGLEGSKTWVLWILIFRGQPRDIQSTRVTDLCLEAVGHPSFNCTFHLDGQPGEYVVRENWNLPEPRLRDNFHQKFHVATLQDSLISDATIQQAILSVPLRQNESDFNCQTWVGDVIDKLQSDGLVSSGEAAVDAMVKNIYQAPWE
jgi:hypothetical protein